MLMITRKPGERIIIGGDIVITLVYVSGQTARIGIDAPKTLPIYREEIWAEVMSENEAAAARAASERLPDVLALPQPAGTGSAAAATADPVSDDAGASPR